MRKGEKKVFVEGGLGRRFADDELLGDPNARPSTGKGGHWEEDKKKTGKEARRKAKDVVEEVKKTKAVAEELPDLEKVQIPRELTKDELVKLEKRRAVTKEYIQKGDEKLQDIEEKIRGIEAREDFPSVVEEGTPEYIPELRERYERLVTAKETILTENEGIQKGFKHRDWVREIRGAYSEIRQGKADGRIKERVISEVEKAVKFHRIRKISKEEERELKQEGIPQSILDLRMLLGPEYVYGPVRDTLTGRVTPATMGIIAELRNVRDAAEKRLKESLPHEIERMKQGATVELLKILTEANVPLGMSYGFLPASQKTLTIDGRERTKRYSELHFVVKIITRRVGEAEVLAVLPIRAAGQPAAEAMFQRLKEKGVYITVNSLKRDDFSVSEGVAAWLGGERVGDLKWFWMILRKTLFYQMSQLEQPEGAEKKTEAEVKAVEEKVAGEKPKRKPRDKKAKVEKPKPGETKTGK